MKQQRYEPYRYRKTKKKYRYRYDRIALLILVLLAIVTGLIFLLRACVRHFTMEPETAPTTEPVITEPETTAAPTDPPTEPQPEISLESIHSETVVLARLDTGEVLCSKNADEIIFPASLTKIMTVILSIEKLQDYEETITLKNEDFMGLYEANASMVGYVPGETAKFIDLLYGTLLASGADCAVGLASHVAGSQEDFIALMNQKAEELGMTHTHFVNVSGLHDDNHYSTANDMKRLLAYALQNDLFREIFMTEQYTTSPTNLHESGHSIRSTLSMMAEMGELNRGPILGGKTGTTKQAGSCLASLAAINGQEYILVTTGARGEESDDTPYHIIDALNIYAQLSTE